MASYSSRTPVKLCKDFGQYGPVLGFPPGTLLVKQSFSWYSGPKQCNCPLEACIYGHVLSQNVW